MRVLAAFAVLGFMAGVPAAIAAEGDVPPPAAAPHAAELDSLFHSLQTTSDADSARGLEQQIWTLWLDSGDETVNTLMAKSMIAMNARAYDLALTFLDAIVAARPDYAEGWNKRATLYWMMGKYPESLSDIDRTLALEPRHFGALSGRGMIYRQMGDASKAMDAFRQALVADPNLADVKAALKALEDANGRDI
jgi:tetratricopeptide (TPR) repeat protein